MHVARPCDTLPVRISLHRCGSVGHSRRPWRCRLTWSRCCPLLLGSAITICALRLICLHPGVISPGREADAEKTPLSGSPPRRFRPATSAIAHNALFRPRFRRRSQMWPLAPLVECEVSSRPARIMVARRHGAWILLRTSQFSLSPGVFGVSPLMVVMDAASSATTSLAVCSTARTSFAGMTAAPEASAKT